MLNTSIFVEIYKEKLQEFSNKKDELGLEPLDLEKLDEVLFLIERIGMCVVHEPKLLRQVIEIN